MSTMVIVSAPPVGPLPILRQTPRRLSARSECRKAGDSRRRRVRIDHARPSIGEDRELVVAVARDERPLAVRSEDGHRGRAGRIAQIHFSRGRDVLPSIVNTDTVPSLRLATSASVPAALMDTPEGPLPACSVLSTAGGDDFRSMTVTVSSGIVFVGSAGSILVDAVTSAIDSSGATATLCGGLAQLPARDLADHLGRRHTKVEDGHRIGWRISHHRIDPFDVQTLLSLDETASCAWTAGRQQEAVSHE